MTTPPVVSHNWQNWPWSQDFVNKKTEEDEVWGSEAHINRNRSAHKWGADAHISVRSKWCCWGSVLQVYLHAWDRWASSVASAPSSSSQAWLLSRGVRASRTTQSWHSTGASCRTRYVCVHWALSGIITWHVFHLHTYVCTLSNKIPLTYYQWHPWLLLKNCIFYFGKVIFF